METLTLIIKEWSPYLLFDLLLLILIFLILIAASRFIREFVRELIDHAKGKD